MHDYIIIGDSEKYKDCLICVCGTSFEHANEVLSRMLTDPTNNDKRLMQGCSNFRIKRVPFEDCWWRQNYD